MSGPLPILPRLEFTNADMAPWVVTFEELVQYEYSATRPQGGEDTHIVGIWQAVAAGFDDNETFSIAAVWNDAGDPAQIAGVLAWIARSTAYYQIGSGRVRGVPTVRPVLYPAYQGLIDMVLGGVYTDLRFLGAGAAFRPLCYGEDPESITTWLPPLGVVPEYDGGGRES